MALWAKLNLNGAQPYSCAARELNAIRAQASANSSAMRTRNALAIR